MSCFSANESENVLAHTVTVRSESRQVRETEREREIAKALHIT